jgi:type II secretory pathway component PulJ
MPWWSWILIWGGLVLALLAMLALMAWWLFRKAVGVMEELGQLAEKTELLSRMSDELADADAAPFVPAVLLDRAGLAAQRSAYELAREQRRRARREKRITRARLLIRADYRDAAMRIKGV